MLPAFALIAAENPLEHVVQHPLVTRPAHFPGVLGKLLTHYGVITLLSSRGAAGGPTPSAARYRRASPTSSRRPASTCGKKSPNRPSTSTPTASSNISGASFSSS
jgi:hypothetical protein